MVKEYYTVIIFNKLEDKPKKIIIQKKVFKSLLYSTIFFAVALVGITAFLSNQYYTFNKNIAEINLLREKASHQKVNIENFNKKLKLFEGKLSYIDTFNKKLRSLTLLKSEQETTQAHWGIGGSSNLDDLSLNTNINKRSSNTFEKLNKRIASLSNELKQQMVTSQKIDNYFKENVSFLSSTPSIWPTKGWVTSTFGYRKSPFTGRREMHEGLDIATRIGAPVIAPGDGIVKRAAYNKGYGKLVEIDHGYGLLTRFGHNSRILVKVGEKVKRGQLIAEVGNTGRSTGPHLHYEVFLNKVPVNPYSYILDRT